MQICYMHYLDESNTHFLKQKMQRELKKVNGAETRLKVVGCAMIIAFNNINMLYAATSLDAWKSKIDAKGKMILSMIQWVGYWLALISCAAELIKGFRKQDISAILSIVIRYAIYYGILINLPWLFDLLDFE